MNSWQVVGCATAIAIPLVACSSPAKDPATPEETVRAATQAIHNEDWRAYKKLTLNNADILAEQMGVDRKSAHSKQGFLGGVMRPQEDSRLRQEFDTAASTSPLRGVNDGELRVQPSGDSLAVFRGSDSKTALIFQVAQWKQGFRIRSVRVRR